MEGRSGRAGEWASIYRKCAYFGICGLMKRLKSSVKMTRELHREGESLREICKISWDGKGKRRASWLNEAEAEKAREVPNADL